MSALAIPFPADRRRSQRFRFEWNLRFSLKKRNSGAVSGFPNRGKTVNISSCGVLFRSEQDVPKVKYLDLLIEWPIFRQRQSLNLHYFGRIVRRENPKLIAVEFLGLYEYCLRHSNNNREIKHE